MAKMTRAANGWVPANHPFDQRIGTQIRLLAQQMAAEERAAQGSTVRAGVHANTVAFTSLARAMAGSSKTKVFKAIGKTQVAYSRLRVVCGLV